MYEVCGITHIKITLIVGLFALTFLRFYRVLHRSVQPKITPDATLLREDNMW